MKSVIHALGFALFAILCLPGSSFAQSVDCNNAVTADELTICSAPRLRKLDRRLGKIHNSVLGAAPRELHYLIREEQAAWIRARNRCRTDRKCIRLHYRARMNELSAIIDEPDEPEVAVGCTVYRHADFAGETAFVKPNSQVSFFGTKFDNQASSVRLGGSCQFLGFTRAFYNGRGERYQKDTPNFGSMNDRISSAQCLCQ